MTNDQNVEPDDDGGAFGAAENVDWESAGFSDEDLSGRPKQAKKQAAPRPAQPRTDTPAAPSRQLPVQQPPAQAPPQAPAQAQRVTLPAAPPAATQLPVNPAPAAHVPTTPTPQQPPAPQALPQQQAPTFPASPPETVAQAYPVPDEALPVHQQEPPAGGHYSTEPASGYTTATRVSLEDLKEPDWARIAPVIADDGSEDDEPIFTGDAFEEPLYPTAPAPETTRGRRSKTDRTSAKRGPKERPAKKAKKQPTARQGKANQYAGGRWKIRVLRGLIYTVLGVLLLGGAKNVITTEEPPTTSELAKQVQSELGLTEFPRESAEAFAVRFTSEYLTYDQATTEIREQRLLNYSPAAAAGDWGWDGTGAQAVITGPYVSAPTQVDGDDYATVTVSAQLSTGQWVALAVPVYANGTGGLVVAGPPAFVAQPQLAENPGKEEEIEPDDELAEQLTTDVAEGFLIAWAASDTTSLARYITPDASIAAQTGLRGIVQFASIDQLIVPLGERTRTGTMLVTWAKPGSGNFTQSYTVVFVQNEEDQWAIKDITGGVVDTVADVTTTSTAVDPEVDLVEPSGPVVVPEPTKGNKPNKGKKPNKR